MTTTTTEPARRRRRSRGRSRGFTRARLRILGWFVLVVVVSVVLGLLLLRGVLLGRIDADAEENIRQELAELETLAGEGTDPATGEPFTDVARLFEVAVQRNVPLDGEAIATFVDGRPFRATPGGERLFDDRDFVAEVAAATSAVQGSVDTPDGPVRFIAQPVVADPGAPRGVFVALDHVGPDREEVEDVVRASVVGGLAVVLGGSALSWVAAGRVLRPVRAVTEAARSITDTDLRRRIPVEGDDDVAELAATFNAMLDRLAAAFEAQRAFADDAGHELRTPITIVQGHLDLLPDDPAERAETLALVQDELDRMARIVNDLLLLARAQRPDFLRAAPVDLAGVVADARDRAVALDDRPWSAALPRDAVVVEGDRERLLQAVLNLCANAARHTPPGAAVTIGVEADGDAGEARLWVHDEGQGIPAADRERIFERFSRGRSASRSADSGGAGLGLPIVGAIAAAHRGRVELDTGSEGGTTFTIVLPLAGA